MVPRVGIARALNVQPEILLPDEPFGALDAMTRLCMQQELLRIWAEEQETTMILVSHVLEEAIFLAYRVLALTNDGTPPSVIKVDLTRPRDRNTLGFVQMRRLLTLKFGLH